MRRLCRQLIAPLLFGTAVLALIALSLYPVYARFQARRAVRASISVVSAGLQRSSIAAISPASTRACRDERLLGMKTLSPPLASWGNVGGCGAGGGAGGGSGGCGKWVGRGVTGGLVDLQTQACPSLAKGNVFNTFNTRIGTGALWEKWNFGLNVPMLYKIGDVSVPTSTLGVFSEQTAQIVGFGDLGLEVTRKLGITNAHSITLSVTAPTGSYDAIRQGVLLPSHLQLGSGVLGVTGQYEYTTDRDWGLLIFGGNASYNGWENSIGGYRGPTLSAYAHAGYLLGPFVAIGGITLLGKIQHDRQHDPDALPDQKVSLERTDADDPLLLFTPNIGIEWSMDTLALLFTAATSLSYNGYEGLSFSLGLQTSLF